VTRYTTRLCAEPGCGQVEVDAPPGWRCPTHTIDKWAVFRASPHGREISGGYNNPRWRRLRDRRMADAGGRCEYCGAPAGEVHHVAGERPSDTCFYDIERVRAVCVACHRRLERERRRAPGRR